MTQGEIDLLARPITTVRGDRVLLLFTMNGQGKRRRNRREGKNDLNKGDGMLPRVLYRVGMVVLEGLG